MKHETSIMMPHGHCYLWQEELLWTHVISDTLISTAYGLITVGIVYITLKRSDLKFDWMFYLFALVFISCGVTHAISVWAVWEPVYYLQGSMKVVTAVASLGTALLLLPLLPKIVSIPSFAEQDELSRELDQESDGHDKAKREMEIQANQLEHSIRVELAEANLNSAVELNLVYFSESARKVEKPLSTVVGDLLRSISYMKSDRQEQAMDLLSGSVRALDQILATVRRMIAAGGIERWEPVFEQTNVTGLVEDLSREWRDQGWTQVVEVQGSVPFLKVDPTGFRMALNDCVDEIQSNMMGNIDRILFSITPIGFSEHLGQPVWSIRVISGSADFKNLRSLPSLETNRISLNLLKKVIEVHHGYSQELYEGNHLVGIEFELPYSLEVDPGEMKA